MEASVSRPTIVSWRRRCNGIDTVSAAVARQVTPPSEKEELFSAGSPSTVLGRHAQDNFQCKQEVRGRIGSGILAGHPNAFPSVLKATTVEWDLLQTFGYKTLLCTQVFKGNMAV